MECSEVRGMLSEAALGDLDEAVAGRVAEHVRGCAECRAAQSTAASVLSALRGAPVMAPSTVRREAVVRAMGRVRVSGPGRSSWLRWGAAAAVFAVAVSAMVVFGGDRGFEFRAASVTGRVELLDRSTGLWRAVVPGEVVRPGDRLVTQVGGFALLDFGTGDCHLNLEPDSSLDFVSGRRIVLDRGRISVEVHASRELVISDTANNTVSLRSGRVEIGLREVKGLVAGSQETKDGVVRIPAAREAVSRRLQARVTEGEADLDGSHRQRLRAVAGQDGTFDFGGQPSTRDPEKK